MTTFSTEMSDTTDAVFRIKRGLCGYVSYLAACDMNQAFSEYVLYEPILRILTAKGFVVQCEYECPGIKQPTKGDKKRLDFYAKKYNTEWALEVKWIKSVKANLDRDTAKLSAFHDLFPTAKSLLCVFGRRSHVEAIELPKLIEHHFVERGKPVYADFRKTRYACRVFEIHAMSQAVEA